MKAKKRSVIYSLSSVSLDTVLTRKDYEITCVTQNTDKCRNKLHFTAIVNGSVCNVMEGPHENRSARVCETLQVYVPIFVYDSQVCPDGNKCDSRLEPVRTNSCDI